MKKIAVLISGSGTNLQAIIDKCNSGLINGEVISVISNDPNAYGLERANKAGIETKIINHNNYDSREAFDEELFYFVQNKNPDLIVLAGFMRILAKKLTDSFFGKLINIHPSLLPKYPGLNTHQKVFDNKDSTHGVSIHFVSSELDSGPLIAQGEIKTKKEESIESMIQRIHALEHSIYPRIIKLFCDDKISIQMNKVIFNNEYSGEDYIYEHHEI